MILALLTGGCSNLQTNLGKQQQEASQIYREAREGELAKTGKTLDWTTAKRLLLKNNLALQRGKNNCLRAEEAKSQIYWNMVPGLRISANLSKALTELGTVESEDLRYSVFSSVNIPGLVSLRTRLYAAELNKLRAKWSLDLQERQLIVSLRELFIEAESFKIRKANLERSQLWSSPSNESALQRLLSTPEEMRLEQDVFRLKVTEDALERRIAKLIGSYEFDWELDPRGIPKLPYATDPLPLDDLDRVGVLYRQRIAADLEALRLRELGTKLRYFPDLNVGISAPPLYQSNSGGSQTLSAEQIYLRAGSSLTIDTSGRIKRALKDARRQIKLEHTIVKEEIRDQIKALMLAQEELQLIERELRLSNLRIEGLRSLPRPQSVEEFRPFLERQLILSEQVSLLELRKSKIEGAFWLLDEGRWKHKPL